MEIHFEPELQATIDHLAAETGRSVDDLLKDAVAGYVNEIAQTRSLLDSRYADIESGKVKLVDGEEAYATLMGNTARQREKSR